MTTETRIMETDVVHLAKKKQILIVRMQITRFQIVQMSAKMEYIMMMLRKNVMIIMA